jgi:MOSC domain-containing protein YiiM
MQLTSVNVGQAETITTPKKTFKTGIFKQPIDTPVQMTSEGLAGDIISNKRQHGGVDQAVIYTAGRIMTGGVVNWTAHLRQVRSVRI